MDRQDIELQLWEYIDGHCDAATEIHVQHMLATDAQWQQSYRSLLLLHQNVLSDKDLEQPSMRFTKNVMESIAHTTVAPATRKYINPLIIRLTFAAFLISLIVLLSYGLYTASWHSSATASSFSMALPQINVRQFFTTHVLNILLWTNVLLGLILLDTLLRKKKLDHKSPS